MEGSPTAAASTRGVSEEASLERCRDEASPNSPNVLRPVRGHGRRNSDDELGSPQAGGGGAEEGTTAGGGGADREAMLGAGVSGDESPQAPRDSAGSRKHAISRGRCDDSSTGSVDESPITAASFQPRLSAKEVHRRLQECLAAMCWADRNTFLWFKEVHRRRLYREFGYSSIEGYATQELGVSSNRIRRYLHLIKALEPLPLIRRALYSGELGWTKVRAIVKVSSPTNEARWLAAARELGRRALEEKVAFECKRRAMQRRSDPAQPGLEDANVRSLEKNRVKACSSHVSAVGTAAGSQTSPPTLPDVEQKQDLARAGATLMDESDVSIVLRLSPVELARFEAMLERIRKLRGAPASASREQILLQALDALAVNAALGMQDPQAARTEQNEHEEGPASNRKPERPPVPRGTPASTYTIVIYKCDSCGAAVVRTQRGFLPIAPAQLAAAECDAHIIHTRNRMPRSNSEDDSPTGHGMASRPGQAGAFSTKHTEPLRPKQTELVRPKHTEPLRPKQTELVRPTHARTSADAESPSAEEVEALPADAESPSAEEVEALPADAPASTLCSEDSNTGQCGAQEGMLEAPAEAAAAGRGTSTSCDRRASIPPSVRCAVFTRDRYRCQGRGCVNTRFLEVHHIIPRERGGGNDPANLVTLCNKCHRLWHEKNLDARWLRRSRE